MLPLLPALQPKDMGLPVHAYTARDEVREDGTQKSQRVFVNLPTEVGATEAEEIGECLEGWREGGKGREGGEGGAGAGMWHVLPAQPAFLNNSWEEMGVKQRKFGWGSSSSPPCCHAFCLARDAQHYFTARSHSPPLFTLNFFRCGAPAA